MFKRILVAVDGSATSKAGLKTAIALAKEQNASLLIMHVVDERMTMLNPEAGAYVETMFEMLREGGRKVVADAEALARKQAVPFKTAMIESFGLGVAEVIVRHAQKSRADLIVLGTHGRRGMNRLVMGSDAESVVRQVTVPVLLVKGPNTPARKAAKTKK